MAVVKRTAVNMGMQISLLYIELCSFRCMPKSGMAIFSFMLFLVLFYF
jgi:hypothetical protein